MHGRASLLLKIILIPIQPHPIKASPIPSNGPLCVQKQIIHLPVINLDVLRKIVVGKPYYSLYSSIAQINFLQGDDAISAELGIELVCGLIYNQLFVPRIINQQVLVIARPMKRYPT